jgi:hypothetical protein
VKIFVGTETYLSEKFMRVWIAAAKKNLPSGVTVYVFDNNPENEPETKTTNDLCKEAGFNYFKMIPSCLQCHSVDMLYWAAVKGGADIFVHLDIDCPPLSGVFEKIIAPVVAGASAATEGGGAHCFAVRTRDAIDMTAQRLPHYPGEVETRFSKMICHNPLAGGVKYFDHCRWIFHDLERRGKEVVITNFNPLHPTIATLGNEKSHRMHDCRGKEELIKAVSIAHKAFWENPEVRELI